MTKPKSKYVPCTIKQLEIKHEYAAALHAIRHNPVNRPPGDLTREKIAIQTTKYWGAAGVHLTVGFMGQISAALADKILLHMNAWGKFCNASFSIATSRPQVRISFDSTGYWSYLGTDVTHISTNQATMNLQGFNRAGVLESEYNRVVRHETGHTLGCVHEHTRRAIVAKLDVQKTIAYFSRTQGWSAQEVQQQVLTPIEESALLHTPAAFVDSVMCYGLPAEITVDNRAIPGGIDITPEDGAFLGTLYPLAVTPPPPSGVETLVTVGITGKIARIISVQ